MNKLSGDFRMKKHKHFLTVKEQYELVCDELKRMEKGIRWDRDFYNLKYNIMLLHEMMCKDLKELEDKINESRRT